MIDFTEEQIAAREPRNTAYHEAGHKMLYERFGGAGDPVVWKNDSGNPDESAWFGQFRPRTCPEVMRAIALNHGFAAPELPANWKMLVGMAGLLAEEILSGETEDTGAMADSLVLKISFGEASASDLALMVSRGGVKEPGMGGVMAPAEPGVKRGFERFQGCGFLPFLATAF
ncbi:hypothetical protein [Burkholderia contaminans]|uniref:hypothetical protein n=1 Tax=Burkholderia contaminans TaxID=488447 RepID=UPI001E435458|nr:hypothetical protein [Burkholderia contaminans]